MQGPSRPSAAFSGQSFSMCALQKRKVPSGFFREPLTNKGSYFSAEDLADFIGKRNGCRQRSDSVPSPGTLGKGLIVTLYSRNRITRRLESHSIRSKNLGQDSGTSAPAKVLRPETYSGCCGASRNDSHPFSARAHCATASNGRHKRWWYSVSQQAMAASARATLRIAYACRHRLWTQRRNGRADPPKQGSNAPAEWRCRKNTTKRRPFPSPRRSALASQRLRGGKPSPTAAW